MTPYELMNITPYEVTKGCVDWCRKSISIHETNVGIHDLAFIALALISLIANYTISNHPETLMEISGVTEYQLSKAYDSTYVFTFLMLVIYIIYMVWFK